MSLNSRAKVRVAAALCRPWVGRVAAFLLRDRIPNRGCVIDTSGAQTNPATVASILFGFYESAEIRFIRRYLRKDLDVVELGGSIGVASSHIARRIDPARRLICVEPNPALLESIRRNVRLNSPGRPLLLVQRAIDYSTEGGQVKFAVGESHLGSRLASRATDSNAVLSAERTTLSQIVDDYALAEFALVADIEGAEVGVLLRERDALSRCRQIIIELHDAEFEGRHYGVPDMLSMLVAEHGFHPRDRRGPVVVVER